MGTGLQIHEAEAQPQAAPFERRAACRIHTVMRVAKVTRANDVGLWRVRNISDEGMMMLTGVPLETGERLQIQLSDRAEIEAQVVWWDGERCGVAFDEPIDCTQLLHDLVDEQKQPRHRRPRLPVKTRALLYSEKGLHSVQVTDLSHHGAGFAHDGSVREGMAIKLLLPDGDEHRGVVRWSQEGRAGMFLLEPFPCAGLESAARI